MTVVEDRPDALVERTVEVRPGPPAGNWLTSADHKQLGLLFVGGALLFLLVGTALGLVLRAELVAEDVQLVGGRYTRLFSMHATVSALLFLIPAWTGLATFLVPLQIGSARLAFPRLHAFALWLFLLGGGLVLVAYVVGPPAGLGFTAGRPIPAPRGGSDPATSLVIMGVAMVAVSMVLAAADLAVTLFKLRVPGLTLRRLPMFSWATLASSIVTLLATPVFLAGLTLFYLDQRFGGTLFRARNPAAHAVWEHTVWLFGRPEVYLLLLPGLGAACDIVATHARRPLRNFDGARRAITLFAALAFTAWAADPRVADALVLPTYSVLTSLVVLPLALLALVWLATLARGRPRLHVSLLFEGGFLLLTGFGALNAVVAAAVGVTGTAWTTGHLHTVAFGAPTLLLFAALYHWAPKLLGRLPSPGLAATAFLGLFGGFFLMGLGSYLLGYDGAPARVRDYPFTTNSSTFSVLAALGAVVLVLGLLAFLADLGRILTGRAAPAVGDPYEGLTLEWATSSPPPPQNFVAVPEVRSAHPLLDLRAAAGDGTGGGDDHG